LILLPNALTGLILKQSKLITLAKAHKHSFQQILLLALHLGMQHHSMLVETLDININHQQFTIGITHGQPPQPEAGVIKELFYQANGREVLL
jgi:hypothetical protein